MSKHIAEVVEYTLEPHPNADTLSIAKVKGWQCVVKTENFIDNEQDPFYCGLGVYIPLDMIAPADHPLLSFLEGKRLKTVKLRGELSQGVVLPLKTVCTHYLLKKLPEVGDDLTELLGVKRWEPPVEPGSPTSVKGGGHEDIPRPAWLSKYTDIENWNHWNDVITPGTPVIIQEKLHGSNSVYALVDGKFYVCSRNRVLRTTEKKIYIPRHRLFKSFPKWLRLYPFFSVKVLPAPDSVWHKVATKYRMEEVLRNIQKITGAKNVGLYGEVLGTQDLLYDVKKGDVGFYAFDIRLDENDYVRPENFLKLMEKVGVPVAPVLKIGPFELEDLNLRLGKTLVGEDVVSEKERHIREGIVIKPLEPLTHRSLGRVILKRISEDYLMRKNAKDR